MADKEGNTPLDDVLSSLYRELGAQIPAKAKVEVKKEKDTTNKVVEYNQKIIETYLNGETEHLKQQKPVGVIIAITVGLQLVAFNVLIYLITLKSYDIEKMSLLFDFMKYYTSAVIVEMLGLCYIVVRGIYSMSLGKMVEQILKKRNK